MFTYVVVLYEKRWVSIIPSHSLETHARSTALPKSALIPYLAYLVINLQRANSTDYLGSKTSSLGLVLLVSLLRMFGVTASIPVWMAVVAEVDSGVACLERVVGAILVCVFVIFVDNLVSLDSKYPRW